jgi:hypothetical protein
MKAEFLLWSNPVYLRLARAGGLRTLKGALRLAAILGGIGLVWGIADTLAGPASMSCSSVFGLLAWALLIATPPVMAVSAAGVAASDAQSEAYQLMKLTDLTEREIALGYVLVALTRCRALAAPAITLAPTAVLYAALLSLGFGTSPAVEVFACAVGLLALMVIGAGGGAWLGMRWPRPALASVAAGVTVGAASLAGVAALLGSVLGGPNHPVSEMFAVVGLCGALPLLLAWLAVSGALQRRA